MENIDKIIQDKIKKDLENKFNEGFTVLRETIKEFLEMGDSEKEMAKLLKEVLEKYLDPDTKRHFSNVLIDSNSDFLKTSKYVNKNLDYNIKKHLEDLDKKEKTEVKYEKLFHEKADELRQYKEKIYNEKYNKKEEEEDAPGEEKIDYSKPPLGSENTGAVDKDFLNKKQRDQLKKCAIVGTWNNPKDFLDHLKRIHNSGLYTIGIDPAKPGADKTSIQIFWEFKEEITKENLDELLKNLGKFPIIPITEIKVEKVSFFDRLINKIK